MCGYVQMHYMHVQLCENVLHDVQLCANALHAYTVMCKCITCKYSYVQMHYIHIRLCANEKRITNQKPEQGELEAVILQKNFKNMKQTKTEH